jgi:phosphohistidine phosphatase
MARQLWLLRHADAEPHGTRQDSERRLTERGQRQARLAGVALGRAQVRFDAVLVSPKVRAQQTAQLAVEGWGEGQGPLRTHAPLAGGFDAVQALDVLSAIPADGRLLLVGHEPDLSGVVAELTGASVDLKKGGVAVVRLEGGADGRRASSRAPLSGSEGGADGRRASSRAPLSGSEGGADGRRAAGQSGDSRQRRVSPGFGRAPLSRSEGGGGELVILLRPRELALIADLATADV